MSNKKIGVDLSSGRDRCSYSFEVRCLVVTEPAGQLDRERFTILAARLPGCCSHGETKEEAIENFINVFARAAEIYFRVIGGIPWNVRNTALPSLDSEEIWLPIEIPF